MAAAVVIGSLKMTSHLLNGRLGVLLGVFLLVVQYHIILWNLGIRIDPLWVLLVLLLIITDWAVICWACR